MLNAGSWKSQLHLSTSWHPHWGKTAGQVVAVTEAPCDPLDSAVARCKYIRFALSVLFFFFLEETNKQTNSFRVTFFYGQEIILQVSVAEHDIGTAQNHAVCLAQNLPTAGQKMKPDMSPSTIFSWGGGTTGHMQSLGQGGACVCCLVMKVEINSTAVGGLE